jgi:hypothetical protein
MYETHPQKFVYVSCYGCVYNFRYSFRLFSNPARGLGTGLPELYQAICYYRSHNYKKT